MGTRAQFFVGNPMDLGNRVWLGTIAWDGYPDGDCNIFSTCKTEKMFIDAVKALATKRNDFCDPNKHSFPFPWKDDLFLTDCTYAFFDGAVQFTWFHRGFVPLADYLHMSKEESNAYSNGAEQLPSNVAAPVSEGPPGPDSIIVVSARSPSF